MKCFIASAFERDDVDAIYDQCVKPTLRKLNVKPLRVDRIEHNENIDQKIIDLLEEADIAIADLTYARPSVYYEAGYAIGNGKQVVYIARKDHFHARDDDPEDLFRVHFDLQMKNIIPWIEPNPTFSAKLERRLRHVLRPLLIRQKEADRIRAERSEFNQLAENAQISVLRTKAENLLKSRSFSLHPPERSRDMSAMAVRDSKHSQQVVVLVCTPSAVKRVFDGIYFHSAMKGSPRRRERPLQLHYLVVSLKSVPVPRVKQALPSFRVLEDGSYHHGTESESGLSVDIFVHVLGGVRSQSEFADDIRSIFARYNLERGSQYL